MRYIIIPLLIFVFGCGPHETKPSKMLAYNLAQIEVKKHLKDPKSAEFPGIFDRDAHTFGGLNVYTINSWVDAKNAFDGTVRTKWSCLVEFDENDPDKYYIKHFRIE